MFNLFKKENKKENILSDNLKNTSIIETAEEVKVTRSSADQFFKAVRAFETDRVALAQSNAKNAWRVATGVGVIALLAVGAVIGLTPLKTVVPYVIRVDNNTGFTDVAPAISDNKTSYGQELDKYWLAKFIINRESYEWQTVQNMYNIVELMSSGSVFSEYKNIINNKSTSPLYILKQEKKVMVKVVSVSFIDDVAQVRFVKYIKNRNGTVAEEYPQTSWISTIAYDYKKKINKEVERMINPLGFQVISYRVDPEVVAVQNEIK